MYDAFKYILCFNRSLKARLILCLFLSTQYKKNFLSQDRAESELFWAFFIPIISTSKRPYDTEYIS